MEQNALTYKIWMTQGQGGDVVDTCNTLNEALALVEKYKDDGSFGIEYPNGTWHNWSKTH